MQLNRLEENGPDSDHTGTGGARQPDREKEIDDGSPLAGSRSPHITAQIRPIGQRISMTAATLKNVTQGLTQGLSQGPYGPSRFAAGWRNPRPDSTPPTTASTAGGITMKARKVILRPPPGTGHS